MKQLISKMESKLDKIYLGGGQKRIDKEHAKGKMTARERVSALVDPNTDTIEMGAFAGYDMYLEHGGCPGGGVGDQKGESVHALNKPQQ